MAEVGKEIGDLQKQLNRSTEPVFKNVLEEAPGAAMPAEAAQRERQHNARESVFADRQQEEQRQHAGMRQQEEEEQQQEEEEQLQEDESLLQDMPQLEQKPIRDQKSFVKFGMEQMVTFAKALVRNYPLIQPDRRELKKRSISYQELYYATEVAIKEFAPLAKENSKAKIKSYEHYFDVAMRLSEAADSYYHLHRGHRSTTEGKIRKDQAMIIRTLTRGLINNTAAAVTVENKKSFSYLSEEEGRVDRRNLAKIFKKHNPDGADPKAKVQELASMYRKWAKHIGMNACVSSVEEQLNERLGIFEAYDRYIDQYKALYEVDEYPAEVRDCLTEYEFLKRRKAISQRLEQNKEAGAQEKQTVLGLINKHLEEEDEKKSEPLSSKEVDKGLTDKQIAGVEAIDEWLIRNYSNGGLKRLVTSRRNHYGDFVSSLLKKSKRERLFMYYLVEKQTRKSQENAVMHLGNSQVDYVPNLKAFKNQMLATKWKVIPHITGTYVYIHKLCEAFQINEQYKEGIKAAAYALNQDAAPEELNEKEENEKKRKNPGEKRKEALASFLRDLKLYDTKLKAIKKAGKNAGPGLEAEAKAIARKLQKKAKGLVDLDKQVARKEYFGVKDMRGQADSTLLAGKESMQFTKVMSFVTKRYDFGWGLDHAGWENLQFWTADVAGSLAMTESLLTGCLSIYSLTVSGGDMTGGEIAENVLKIVKSSVKFAKDTVSGVHYMEHAADLATAAYSSGETAKAAAEAAASTPLMKSLGAASVGMNGIIAASKWISYSGRSKKVKSAEKYFREKRYYEYDPDEEKREKFEKGMVLLSQKLSNRTRKSAIHSTVLTGIGVTGIVIPGIGTAAAAVAGLIYSVTTGIMGESEKVTIAQAIFDHYFNMDRILDDVILLKIRERGGNLTVNKKKEVRTRLRRRVAAAAGFGSMRAAQTYICGKYCDYIRNKLFGEEEAEDKEEFINLVQSMGLKYDEAKGKPTKARMLRKMMAR